MPCRSRGNLGIFLPNNHTPSNNKSFISFCGCDLEEPLGEQPKIFEEPIGEEEEE